MLVVTACGAWLVTAPAAPLFVRDEGHAKGKPPTNKAAKANPPSKKHVHNNSDTAHMQGGEHTALQGQHSLAAAAAWR